MAGTNLIFWDANIRNKPWRTWFYCARYAIGPDWPTGMFWWYRIPPEAGHKEQVAVRSETDQWIGVGTSAALKLVKKDVLYIITYPGDTPNWGNTSQFIGIGRPCSNWLATVFEETQITRSQTYGLLAALQSDRALPAKITAAAAKTGELVPGITATIQATPELPIITQAAISGNPEINYPIRAAIRSEPHLEPGIIAAVGKDFSLDCGTIATIQGNPLQWYGTRAAIKGETERSVGIKAFVVKSRVNQIMLEMENLWPQELDLRSTPNSPSKWNDWRKDRLGE